MATPDNSDTQQNDGSFTWFETGVNGGVQILSLLKDASALAPVPYLKQAAGLTVNIIGIIQSLQDNKSDFRRLGRDAASLLVAVLDSYHNAENKADWPGTHLQGAVDNLIETLLSIQSFVQKQLNRGLVVRFLNNVGDRRVIKEYREMLTEATNRFGLSSQLEASDALRTINLRLNGFLRNPQDPMRPTPHQQKSIDFMEQWKRNADLNLSKRSAEQESRRDSWSKRESRKNTKSSLSEGLPNSPLRWDIPTNYTSSPQQWPQSPPWTPTYVGMPMQTGGPVHITNIDSGNVTTKTRNNVGNNNSIFITTA